MTGSNTPPWLLKIGNALRRLGLPLTQLVAGQGELSLSFDLDDGPLVVKVQPRRAGAPGQLTTARFVVGYDGARALNSEELRAVAAVAFVLKRIEPEMPGDLSEPAAIFAPSVSNEERFHRLYRFCTVEHSHTGSEQTTEVLVRTTRRCNQSCPFCSAPPEEAPSSAALFSCLSDAAGLYPGALLTLTGGEPTLRSTFQAELTHALELTGLGRIQVQTNAVSFACQLDPNALPRDPRLRFFVSLHGLDPELYDRCTGTSDQLPLALAGLTRLISMGFEVVINCVVQRLNLPSLLHYVRELPRAVPLSERTELHFSTLLCPEYNPRALEFLVRYREAAPLLEEAVALGEALGLRVQPLRSSTHAAMPPCLLDEREGPGQQRRPRLGAQETGYEDMRRPWVKADSCRACVEDMTCLGLPRPYVERFGLEELRPMGRGAGPPPGASSRGAREE